MIEILTYNDLLDIGENERDRMEFVLSAIRECKGSEKYKYAEVAEKYYDGENPDIYALEKVIYDFRGLAHRDMFSANHKISSSFFGFVVNQETSYLLANGVSFAKKETKQKLGVDFDDKLADLYADGAIAGVAFGFWNYDHLEVFKFNAAYRHFITRGFISIFFAIFVFIYFLIIVIICITFFQWFYHYRHCISFVFFPVSPFHRQS